MSVNLCLQNLKKILIDVTPAGDRSRQGLRQALRFNQIGSILGMGATAALLHIAVVSAVAHPILGALGAVLGTTMLILFYDSYRVSKNIINIMDDTQALGNIRNQGQNGWSLIQFISAVFKGTVILRPFVSNSLLQHRKNTI